MCVCVGGCGVGWECGVGGMMGSGLPAHTQK
jgi:hypothetical protein